MWEAREKDGHPPQTPLMLTLWMERMGARVPQREKTKAVAYLEKSGSLRRQRSGAHI